jgi:hypothetical protein
MYGVVIIVSPTLGDEMVAACRSSSRGIQIV